MNILQKENKKSPILMFIVLVVIVLVISIFFTLYSSQRSRDNVVSIDNNQSRYSCQQNSDCVLVPKYDGCCPAGCESEVMTIKEQKISEQNRDKQYKCYLKDMMCFNYKCKPENKKAVCEQNRCVAKEVSIQEKLCRDTGGKYSSFEDCPPCPAGVVCEACFVGCSCPTNTTWNEAKGCGSIITNNLNCADLQKEITKDLDNLNYCQTKDDCIVNQELSGCPFGCGSFINKNITDKQFIEIKNKIDGFHNLCEQCVYKCKTPQNLDCIQNKCISAFDLSNNQAQSLNSTDGQYKIISSYTSPGESSFVEKIDNTVFLTDISEGLLAINVSNPQKPELLSKTKIGGGGAYAITASQPESAKRDIIVSGYENSKVNLINIVNPAELKIIKEINAKRSVQDMVKFTSTTYLAIDGPEIEILSASISREEFGTIIISKEILQIKNGGHAIGIAIVDVDNDKYRNILAVAQGESGVGVYDIKKALKPELIFVSNVGYIRTVAVDKKYVYAGTSDEVKIIDLNTQKVIGEIPANAWRLKIKDNLLYVAEGEKGVTIVDVSDPTKPRFITTVDTPGRARDMVIDGDYIYVADDRDDLQVIQRF